LTFRNEPPFYNVGMLLINSKLYKEKFYGVSKSRLHSRWIEICDHLLPCLKLNMMYTGLYIWSELFNRKVWNIYK